MIIIVILLIILVGGFIFQKIQNKKSIKDGIKDFLTLFAYVLGWRPTVNHNLILTFEEAELWLETLGSLVHEPDLLGCLVDELNGVLVINIDFLSFTSIVAEKSKLNKQRAIARSISTFYRIQRRVRIDWKKVYFQALTNDFFEVWIPLNQKGCSLIQELKAKKIKR